MKTVLLLRHAKSDWHTDHERDHERPLSARGRSAAGTVGRFLQAAGEVPDLVVCSTAMRTRQTLARATKAGEWNTRVEHTDDLYEAHVETALEVIRRTDPAVESLMLVGHEPTSSSLAASLVGGGLLRFPTAAMIRIDLAVDSWDRVDGATGHVVWFVHPRLLARIEREQGP